MLNLKNRGYGFGFQFSGKINSFSFQKLIVFYSIIWLEVPTHLLVIVSYIFVYSEWKFNVLVICRHVENFNGILRLEVKIIEN